MKMPRNSGAGLLVLIGLMSPILAVVETRNGPNPTVVSELAGVIGASPVRSPSASRDQYSAPNTVLFDDPLVEPTNPVQDPAQGVFAYDDRYNDPNAPTAMVDAPLEAAIPPREPSITDNIPPYESSFVSVDPFPVQRSSADPPVSVDQGDPALLYNEPSPNSRLETLLEVRNDPILLDPNTVDPPQSAASDQLSDPSQRRTASSDQYNAGRNQLRVAPFDQTRRDQTRNSPGVRDQTRNIPDVRLDPQNVVPVDPLRDSRYRDSARNDLRTPARQTRHDRSQNVAVKPIRTDRHDPVRDARRDHNREAGGKPSRTTRTDRNRAANSKRTRGTSRDRTPIASRDRNSAAGSKRTRGTSRDRAPNGSRDSALKPRRDLNQGLNVERDRNRGAGASTRDHTRNASPDSKSKTSENPTRATRRSRNRDVATPGGRSRGTGRKTTTSASRDPTSSSPLGRTNTRSRDPSRTSQHDKSATRGSQTSTRNRNKNTSFSINADRARTTRKNTNQVSARNVVRESLTASPQADQLSYDQTSRGNTLRFPDDPRSSSPRNRLQLSRNEQRRPQESNRRDTTLRSSRDHQQIRHTQTQIRRDPIRDTRRFTDSQGRIYQTQSHEPSRRIQGHQSRQYEPRRFTSDRQTNQREQFRGRSDTTQRGTIRRQEQSRRPKNTSPDMRETVSPSRPRHNVTRLLSIARTSPNNGTNLEILVRDVLPERRFRDPSTSIFPNNHDRRLCYASGDSCFSYNDQAIAGPSCWYALDEPRNNCCDESGSFQSPINLPANDTVEDMDRFMYYTSNEPISGRLENNGVYPKWVADTTTVSLLGVGNPHDPGYLLDSISIHFGRFHAARQTEHLIDGKSYDAEVHIVHYREDLGSLAEASLVEDGVLIIAVFLSHENWDRENTGFKEVLEKVSSIKDFDESGNVCIYEDIRVRYNTLMGFRETRSGYQCFSSQTEKEFPNYCQLYSTGSKSCGKSVEDVKIYPNDMLPAKPEYYAYRGSFTSPPCSESVKWLVAEIPDYVKWEVLQDFRDVASRLGNEKIARDGNLRPIQKTRRQNPFRIKFKSF